MSSTTPPVLGCRIRIISKAQIRYEGYLHSVDADTPNDPVITLSKVWSFGTEDRPSERPVGPRSEVYDQIVFRGRDLEDVRVIQSSVFLNDDPSIVSVEPGSSSTTQEKPREDGDAPDAWGSSSTFGRASKPSPVVSIQRSLSIEKPNISLFPNFMTPKPPADLLPELTRTPWNPPSHLSTESDRNSNATPSAHDVNADEYDLSRPYSNQREFQDDKVDGSRGRGYHGNRGFRPPYPGGQRYAPKPQNRSQENWRDDLNPPMRQKSNQSSFSRGAGRGRIQRFRPFNQNEPNQPLNSFTEEYDIEKANAELAEELEKIAITTENANGSTSENTGENSIKEEECYDSKKSFFDTISSEMMCRSQGIDRRSGREERRQNIDTFGPAASRMGGNTYRGGNRYNNRRGGGYYGGNKRGGNTGGSFSRQSDRPSQVFDAGKAKNA